MHYRPLGNSGVQVSVVGLGCSNFGGRLDLDGTRAVVDAALHAGITPFDTADIYGGHGASESLLGEVLPGRRDQVVLATKFGHQRHDLGYPRAAGAKGGRAYIRRPVAEPAGRLATRPSLLTDEKLDRAEALTKWGQAHGRSLLEIAIGALAAQPGCSSVIAGATKPEQVNANVAAGEWQPTPEELGEINEIVPPPLA